MSSEVLTACGKTKSLLD